MQLGSGHGMVLEAINKSRWDFLVTVLEMVMEIASIEKW